MGERVQDKGEDLLEVSFEDPVASTLILKHRSLYAIFDNHGNIDSGVASDRGLYSDCTRYLNRYRLTLEDGPEFLSLNAQVTPDNDLVVSDLTNAPFLNGEETIGMGAIHLHREAILYDRQLLERITVHNHRNLALTLRLRLEWDADFSDLFGIRGVDNQNTGQILKSKEPRLVSYRGADQIERATRLAVHGDVEVDYRRGAALIEIALEPGEESVFVITATCCLSAPSEESACEPREISFGEARKAAKQWASEFTAATARLQTPRDRFQKWMDQSWADLRMLTTETPWGLIPYAGVPWFCAPFGRDSLLAARQLLTFAPEVAKGTLRFLAAHQAEEFCAETEAEPGKIIHEMRSGEYVNLGRVPYGRYYGSVDSTSLFVWLLSETIARTADQDLLIELEPALEAALKHLFREMNGDSFIYYDNRSKSGLIHQGWKDADDAVFHQDGSDGEAPIALCEVQAYTYAALRGAARLYQLLENHGEVRRLEATATRLQERFLSEFWLPELGSHGFAALALDRNGPCRVMSSNAIHSLLFGIYPDDIAKQLIESYRSSDLFSGWGVRTVAPDTIRYSPLSYHNGSVWPHDSALCMAGLSRFGEQDDAARIFAALFDASENFAFRLPELMSGYLRRTHATTPIRYPNACSPQAWAAGSVFLMLEAALGLEIDAAGLRVIFHRPWLPEWIGTLHIHDLPVGPHRVSFQLKHRASSLDLSVLSGSEPSPVSFEVHNQP
ncbi:MAG: glycogen debranching N-terminal domain-containing protein [Verrucomicrobiota bacterium JB023]|nr:glycogen debranching N-terminal domain-containing protein [Verrucomicrobiota bacterium JB023]